MVTVAGVGVALTLPSRPPWGLLSAVLGGLLFAVAAAIKVVTLPIAMIGLVALLLVDRRRCAIALVGAILGGLAWIVGVALEAPWEFQWMIDTAAMVPDRGGPDVAGRGHGVPGQRRGDLADGDPAAGGPGRPRAQPPGGRSARRPAGLAPGHPAEPVLPLPRQRPARDRCGLPLRRPPSSRPPVRPRRPGPVRLDVLRAHQQRGLAAGLPARAVHRGRRGRGVDGRAVDRVARLAVLPIPVGRAAPDHDPARHPGPRGRLAARLCPHRRRVGDPVHAQQHPGQPTARPPRASWSGPR